MLMDRHRRRRAGALLALALVLLTGCAPAEPAQEDAGTIAFLLPELKTARYESIDRPMFEKVVGQRCPGCRVLYANANQDAARQQQQAESALTQGAGVLVLDAVDVASAASIVAAAQARDVPVIAYDRFLAGVDVDYYVSFDSERIGKMQGEAIVAALADRPGPDGVLLVNGSPTDTNAAALRRGLDRALAPSGLRILAEYSTPDWSPDKAQEWVAAQLTQFSGEVSAVYAANDGTAGGALAAMKAAGLDPLPVVTGQDAELAAVQRIVAGDQHMTVYKAISQQARTAAELAVRLLAGEQPVATATVDGVPAMLLTPIGVTRGNLEAVLVRGGVFSAAEICVDPYTEACVDAGLIDRSAG